MPAPGTTDIPQDPGQEVTVPAEGLTDLLKQMLVKKGMFAAEAKIGAQRMVEADLRGIHSHGSRAISRYLNDIDEGGIDPRATILTEAETPAIAVLDGGCGLGHVAATRGIKLAIRKAKEVGTGTVAVKHSQHFGAAGVYALLAAEAGMIGFCTTSTGPATVAAYGSTAPATANNAQAWGVPTRQGPPFVLDMACAEVAWGRIESLRLYGQPMPEGWALDAAGQPTTDPHAAKTLLPAAGARGYGLAFLSSVLAGPLVGHRMPLNKSWSISADGSEHFFYCIDPAAFGDVDAFFAELDRTSAAIRELPPATGIDRVRLPGELEYERATRWATEGIPIHRDHAAKLAELASGLGVTVPWESAS